VEAISLRASRVSGNVLNRAVEIEQKHVRQLADLVKPSLRAATLVERHRGVPRALLSIEFRKAKHVL
jgi:hypothetical protein